MFPGLKKHLLAGIARAGSFGRETAGNFALLMALAAVPLAGAAGFTVDYVNLSRSQSELQQAIDAAVLAVAREGTKITDAQAEQIARKFMSGNLQAVYKDFKLNRKGTTVNLSAKLDIPLRFGGLLGYDKAPVAAQASADIAIVSYEIALVLDTTGSMRGGKLQSMKDAVVGLIEDISAQVPDKSKLKFSLVPFATFVNVGPEHGPKFRKNGKIKKGTGAKWLDIKGEVDIPQVELQAGYSRFEIYNQLGQQWKGCVETRMPSKKGDHDVDDTPASKKDKSSLFVPAFAIDEPAGWQYNNDYIDSSVDPLDNTALAKVQKLLKYGVDPLLGLVGLKGKKPNFSGGRGPNSGCTTQPISPLSNDYKDLIAKVKSLEANGNTNIMEGVAWGMRVLSPHEPFAGGADEPGLEKIMVVLTDGSNVFGNNWNKLGSRYSSFGYLVDGRLDGLVAASSNKTTQAMNDKTLTACGNAKNKYKIEVYTIRLEERDTATGNMLEKCASSPGHYFDAPSRNQLKSVFKEIGEKIVRLRLSS